MTKPKTIKVKGWAHQELGLGGVVAWKFHAGGIPGDNPAVLTIYPKPLKKAKK